MRSAIFAMQCFFLTFPIAYGKAIYRSVMITDECLFLKHGKQSFALGKLDIILYMMGKCEDVDPISSNLSSNADLIPQLYLRNSYVVYNMVCPEERYTVDYDFVGARYYWYIAGNIACAA
jgi:hypothetical protein